MTIPTSEEITAARLAAEERGEGAGDIDAISKEMARTEWLQRYIVSTSTLCAMELAAELARLKGKNENGAVNPADALGTLRATFQTMLASGVGIDIAIMVAKTREAAAK